MRIDPNVERAARDALDHALKGRLEEIPQVLRGLGDDAQYRSVLELCVAIAGYVAVDVCGSTLPGEAELRKIAENMARVTASFDLNADDVKSYLSRVVFGREMLSQVFTDQNDAAFMPILTAASMIVTFCPKGKTPWDYLDAIEAATEAAASVEDHISPAVIYRSHMSGSA